MQLQNFYAQDVNGNIVPGAVCSLFLPGTTTLATGLTDASGSPLSNPFSANSNGLVQFAAPNGKYDLKIEAGLIVSTLPITFADTYQALIQLGGFLPPSTSAPTTRTDGTPLQLGDRYLNTLDNLEYLYKVGGWLPNNLDGQLMAGPTGAYLTGYGLRTVGARLNDIKSLLDYGSSAVDGTTDNQDRWVAAAAANQGGQVWVPDPGFPLPSSANIPGFHGVHWIGPGSLARGSQIFSIDQFGSIQNTLFVSTTGSSLNDGLSASEPMASPNAAVGIWGLKYAPTAGGPWKIKIAAGSYFESVIGQGFSSNKVLDLEGEYDSINLEPLTIFDGSMGATNSGIIFTTYGWVNCKWITCQNFTSIGAGGFNAGNECRMDINTCHAYNNNLTGFSAAQRATLRIGGRCLLKLAANSTGITYYRLSEGSWYDATGEVIIDGQSNAFTTGVLCRDLSVCVAGCKLTVKHTTAQAVWLRRHSYLELRDYEITDNNVGFDFRDLSLYAPNGGTQILANNTQDYAYRNFSLLWDTPSNMAIGSTGPSVQSPSSGIYALLVSSIIQTGMQFLTDAATSTINIDFNKKGSLVYAQADNSLRISLNSADAYRFNPTTFFPVVSDSKSNGGSTFFWADTWTRRLRFGTTGTILTAGTGSPEGVLTAPQGSQYNRTDGGAGTTLYVKESGAGNTGWVAK